MSTPLPAIGSTAPWSGGRASERAVCVLAPNPGIMTLDGTNTWLLHEPGGHRAVVLDPGPDDEEHLRAVVRAAEQLDLHIVATLLTHGHPDHSAGARSFAALTGTGVRALDPAHRLGSEGLAAGDVVTVDDLEIRVVGTPGHTADSLTFLLTGDGALLTGDTLLGRGTTVVAHPDGRLADYLASLRRLRDLAETAGAQRVLPGHGPAMDDATGLLDAYLVHRAARLDQIRAAVAHGCRSAPEVVATVYAVVPQALWPAAELSVLAQLDYLRELGEF